MAIQEYKIGSTYPGMTNLEDLTTPVPPPKSSFREFSGYHDLGDGTVRGAGWSVIEWRWGFLTRAQRDQLRTFCTGASAAVYINSRKNDSSDAYDEYTATLVWPQEEERDAGKRLDFVLRFINVVEYVP